MKKIAKEELSDCKNELDLLAFYLTYITFMINTNP